MMMRALKAEVLKLKRSRVPLWTALIVLLASGLGLAILPVLSDPRTQAEIAAGGGVFAKAVRLGMYDATWKNYLLMGPQGMAGSWGIVTFGLVASYLFGREFGDGTAKTMFTLPVRRESVVMAKMIVMAVWVFGLGVLSAVFLIGVTALLGADGFGWGHVMTHIGNTLAVCGLFYVTLPFVAWFAMQGKGYLRPMMFSLVLWLSQNGLMSTPFSRWVPWNMPIHLLGASWYPVAPADLTTSSWVTATVVLLAGFALLLWRADHADVRA